MQSSRNVCPIITKSGFSRQIIRKPPILKFTEMSCASRTYTSKRTDTTTVIGAFRELYARAKKISEIYDYVIEVILE